MEKYNVQQFRNSRCTEAEPPSTPARKCRSSSALASWSTWRSWSPPRCSAASPSYSSSTPKDFGPEGEACLDVMANLAAAPELDMELVAVSTDSLEVHRVWRERREAGGPGVMVADRTNQVARSFGVSNATWLDCRNT